MKEYRPLIIIAICSFIVTFLGTFLENEINQGSFTIGNRALVTLLPSSILFGIICGFYFPIKYFVERFEQRKSKPA
jgi:uncharacterized protein YneF (UPF0154 family)